MNAALAFSLLILFATAVPIGVSLVLASAFGITFFSTVPLLLAVQRIFASLDSFPLLAVPLFISSFACQFNIFKIEHELRAARQQVSLSPHRDAPICCFACALSPIFMHMLPAENT